MVHFRNPEYISSIKEYVSSRHNRQEQTGVKRPIGLTLWPNDERKLGIEVKWLEKHGDGYERPYLTNQVFFAGLGDIGSPLVQVFLSRFGVVIYYNGECDTKPYGLLSILVSYSRIVIVCMSVVQKPIRPNIEDYQIDSENDWIETFWRDMETYNNEMRLWNFRQQWLSEYGVTEEMWIQTPVELQRIMVELHHECEKQNQLMYDLEEWRDSMPI